jgi:DNA-binding GntR family transcriptional regulator
MAARLALAEGRGRALVGALTEVAAAMAAAEGGGDGAAATRLDGRYHGVIVAAGGNRRIRRLWASLHPAVWLVGHGAPAAGDVRPLAALHRDLAAYLAACTPAEAQEAIVCHVLSGRRALPGASSGRSEDASQRPLPTT